MTRERLRVKCRESDGDSKFCVSQGRKELGVQRQDTFCTSPRVSSPCHQTIHSLPNYLVGQLLHVILLCLHDGFRRFLSGSLINAIGKGSQESPGRKSAQCREPRALKRVLQHHPATHSLTLHVGYTQSTAPSPGSVETWVAEMLGLGGQGIHPGSIGSLMSQ